MHPKNLYFNSPYDFDALAKVNPKLTAYFITKPDLNISLDFKQPQAIIELNKALLFKDFKIDFWDIPNGNLCPGVPGRLDYIHLIADLIKSNNNTKVKGLDIGTGPSLIYPILGSYTYAWEFVATDIDPQSVRFAEAIAKHNKRLQKKVAIRHQKQANHIFEGVIKPQEKYTFSMCNPPFFDSVNAAQQAAKTKWKKLGVAAPETLSFKGSESELSTPGGEPAFLKKMILESAKYSKQVTWFTTLVSQKGYVNISRRWLNKVKAKQVEVLTLNTGSKQRRILAWRY